MPTLTHYARVSRKSHASRSNSRTRPRTAKQVEHFHGSKTRGSQIFRFSHLIHLSVHTTSSVVSKFTGNIIDVLLYRLWFAVALFSNVDHCFAIFRSFKTSRKKRLWLFIVVKYNNNNKILSFAHDVRQTIILYYFFRRLQQPSSESSEHLRQSSI